MNMNKLHNGQTVTSHGIINTPKSPNVHFSSQENNAISTIRWVVFAILIIVVGAFTAIVSNPNVIGAIFGI